MTYGEKFVRQIIGRFGEFFRLPWFFFRQIGLSDVSVIDWVDSTKFLQWHSSVGLFQLSFSSGVPVYPASIRWVAQWYPSVHWVNQWHSSGIPVYTGPASVHWLRVREVWRDIEA